MTDTRDYLTIVSRLLAKAESTDHRAEAEAFLLKAQELMATYAIDEAMLAEADPARAEKPTSITIKLEPPYLKPKQLLLGASSYANGCHGIQSDELKYIFGFPTALQHVEALWASLSIQATQAMLAESEGSKSFRTSFLYGFALRIRQRLAEATDMARRTAQERAPTGSPGVEVVLASRDAEVEAAMHEVFPLLGTVSPPNIGDGHGFHSGQIAGALADVGQHRVSAQGALRS